jgi:hypothetical protein
MPQLTLEVPHNLGRDEATRRLKEKLDVARETFQGQVSDLHEEWHDQTLTFGFKAIGMAVSGTVAVEDALVRLTTELPWAAMLAKGIIEQRARLELGQVLA